MSHRPQTRTWTVAEVCRVLETIAPPGLAQEWDNIGLLAGDPSEPVTRMLLCIDLTPAVAREAIEHQVNFIHAYHPPIFRPIHALRRDGNGLERVVYDCIRNGIAIYSTHTALDAADGGTNDQIAELCRIRRTEPLQYAARPGDREYKVVVFTPSSDLTPVSQAMFDAGAGHIGDYSRCSFRIPGQGTFFGGDTTSPTVGQKGRLEHADEVRLETWVPAAALPRVIQAMTKAHSYEEPAYDIYPLEPNPVRGIGRIGRLPRSTKLVNLARSLKRATRAEAVQIIGPPDRVVGRAVIVVGAAGSLPFRMPLATDDVIITGEIRHHDALTIERTGCAAIALGHWASERPVLEPLSERITAGLPDVTVQISQADHGPFTSV